MFCGKDEFYDGVVGMCAKCADVCATANDFCSINCPGYTRDVINSAGSQHVATVPMTSFPLVKSASSAASILTADDTLTVLARKPLFWTSVVSLCISVVATSVLVVLCVCRRRQLTTRRTFVYSTARSLTRSNGKSAPECNLAEEHFYSDNRVMLPVSEQESCAGPGTSASLCSVDRCPELVDGWSIYNISLLTDLPHCGPVSWIATEHSISSYHDVDRSQTDGSVTEPRVDGVCETVGPLSLDDHECREAYELACSVQVTDYSSSVHASDWSLADSGTSSISPGDVKSIPPTFSRVQDERTLKSEGLECDVVGSLDCGGTLDTQSSVEDCDDDETQLKLQRPDHVTSQVSACKAMASLVSLNECFCG